MKRILLSFGLLAIALTSISATYKATESGCNTHYRYISRFQCGDVLDGEFIVPPPGGGGPAPCTEIVDYITNYTDPIPVCWHMHPPGGRY